MMGNEDSVAPEPENRAIKVSRGEIADTDIVSDLFTAVPRLRDVI
jgi:hypothetical protein